MITFSEFLKRNDYFHFLGMSTKGTTVGSFHKPTMKKKFEEKFGEKSFKQHLRKRKKEGYFI